MTQHFTRATVEASAWCKKCGKPTMHRIDDRKVGPCLVCLERLAKQEKPAEQKRLFS